MSLSRSSARRSLSAAIAVVATAAMVNGVHPPAAVAGTARPQIGPGLAAEAVAKRVMHGMSLDQKIAQLFVVSVWGKSANEVNPTNQTNYGVDTPAQVIQKYGVGGVIYFNNSGTDNVDDPAQVTALSNGLQRAAISSNTHIPLIVAIDQEGGNVSSLD
ncbi:glycoside hydrolase family 3 N-terminal domain-containing protein [Actinophytocola sp.]|uniref:glycoside hydrolase family 3 N-terminal domain-containing protein n=1 Tax=Actinophytocola sp. TaxID=1872138 RepID=UPI00389A403E